MSQLSKILRDAWGGCLTFFCPGCDSAHMVQIGEGSGHRWGYNNNPDKPTFTPSILIRSGHYASFYKQGEPCWCTYNAEHPENPSRFGCGVCHSFVTDGRIQFLGDCTHALAGQTVDLPEWPSDYD